MRVRVAVLADAANVAEPGKLNIMGIFDTIYCRTFPSLHPLMVLVLQFEVSFDDAGRTHELAVALKDEDLKEFAKAVSKVAIRNIPAGRSGVAHQIMQFAGMQFTRPGSYRFHVVWDGKEVDQVPLHVLATQ
jgi:hypothetical protein